LIQTYCLVKLTVTIKQLARATREEAPMTDPPEDADAAGGSPDPSTTGTPRWVKAFGIIALLVVVLFIVVMLIGGGDHGPGRHTGGGTSGTETTGGHTGPPPASHDQQP
jgi:hypothetical protein